MTTPITVGIIGRDNDFYGEGAEGTKGALTFTVELSAASSQTVRVEYLDEPQEVFRLELRSPEGAQLVVQGTEGMRWPFSVGYIHNDDRGKPEGYDYVFARPARSYTEFGKVGLSAAFGKPITWCT